MKVVACPALSVSGRPGPVTLNPVPDAAAPDTVTLVPPVFVTVTGTVCLLPTVTFPKLALLGFAVNAPAPSPVPVSGMLSGELDASDTMVNDPFTVPALVGVKIVLKLTL